MKKTDYDEKADRTPAALIIFGGTGDLTHRKLMPALYNLANDQLLPQSFVVVSVGRKEKTNEQYRKEVFDSLIKHSRNTIDEKCWAKLQSLIFYFRLDFTDQDGYLALNKYIKQLDCTACTEGNRVFYLATAPEYFETIVHGLHTGNLVQNENSGNSLVIEKPFGKDLATAKALNNKLREVFDEKSIYRIDHYLGKEMIQNIMVLRFCNFVFESLWSNKYIDNIQITLSEEQGIGSRGGYYENSGAMRDMFQNHIVQVLSLIALEPPVSLDTDAIRAEKVKVIQTIEKFAPEYLSSNVVFGQYDKGMIGGVPVPAYNEEDKVSQNSEVETFIAMKLHINNFRWAGTPFYIRTGKRLDATSAKIVVQFNSLPNVLYFKDRHVQEPNLLVIRIQPNVGVFFQFNTKDFRKHNDIISTKMDTCHDCPMQGNTPEAYERLIYDILRRDATLFSRWDEVEASWMLADRIIEYKNNKQFSFPNYEAGTTGPKESFDLLARDHRQWWNI